MCKDTTQLYDPGRTWYASFSATLFSIDYTRLKNHD